jgi:hypothetical protein
MAECQNSGTSRRGCCYTDAFPWQRIDATDRCFLLVVPEAYSNTSLTNARIWLSKQGSNRVTQFVPFGASQSYVKERDVGIPPL